MSPDELARIQAAGLSLAERAFNRSIHVVLKVSDVLTPEQRKKMVETWRQWR